MGTPHKHAEVIKAWADGKQIEFLAPNSGNWVTVGWNPSWDEGCAYRVKPETIRYRVALAASGPITVRTENYAATLVHAPGFKRWLTDWIEVEV